MILPKTHWHPNGVMQHLDFIITEKHIWLGGALNLESTGKANMVGRLQSDLFFSFFFIILQRSGMIPGFIVGFPEFPPGDQ